MSESGSDTFSAQGGKSADINTGGSADTSFRPSSSITANRIDEGDRRHATISGSTSPSGMTLEGLGASGEGNVSNYLNAPESRYHDEKLADRDLLNRKQLVDAVVKMMLDPGYKGEQTIGLLGEWGIGKSSVINLIKSELRRHRRDRTFLEAEFNAWAYEHTDNIQAGIAHEAVKALTSFSFAKQDGAGFCICPKFVAFYRWAKVRCQLALARHPMAMVFIGFSMLLAVLFAWKLPLKDFELLRPIGESLGLWGGNIFKLIVTFGVGWGLFHKQIKKVVAEPLAQDFKTYLTLPDYARHLGDIPEMRDVVRNLCNFRLGSGDSRSRHLLYVIDDLDRCDHESIVKVIQAARLVLNIPNVTVIIAIDHRIALSAFALNYATLSGYHPFGCPTIIARDYLGKVIQLPIVLTPPDDDSMKGFLKNLLGGKVGDNSGVDMFAGGGEVQQESDAELLETGLPDAHQNAFIEIAKILDLRNPRQLKRLSNTYNLMRHLYEESKRTGWTSDDPPARRAAYNYPLLACLLSLEAINDTLEQSARLSMYEWLKTPKQTPIVVSGELAEWLASIEDLLKDGAPNMQGYRCALPFVLPSTENRTSTGAIKGNHR